MNPFGHVDLRVSKLETALPFYEALLPALGFTERVGFANSSAALPGVGLGRFGALVVVEGGLIALVVRVSRRAEPVRAGVAVGTVASVEGVGDSCASPRAGCSAASVGSAEADAG